MIQFINKISLIRLILLVNWLNNKEEIIMSEEFRVSVVIDGSETDSIMVYKEDLEETGALQNTTGGVQPLLTKIKIK